MQTTEYTSCVECYGTTRNRNGGCYGKPNCTVSLRRIAKDSSENQEKNKNEKASADTKKKALNAEKKWIKLTEKINKVKQVLRYKKLNQVRKLLLRWKRELLKIKGGGTGVKGRDGSTRHGLIVTVGKVHGYKSTLGDITKRNNMIGVVSLNRCLYCNNENPTEKDHIIPACNTTHSIYGYSNGLNLVDCCSTCNRSKGGKSLEEWEKSDKPITWNENNKSHFKKIFPKILAFTRENIEKLQFSPLLVSKVEKCFKVINEAHNIWHEWAVASTLTGIESPFSINDKLKSEIVLLKEQNEKHLVEIATLKDQIKN